MEYCHAGVEKTLRLVNASSLALWMFRAGDCERMVRMRYKVLGRTGLKVSEVCLGTMTFGGSGPTWKAIGALDEKQSTEMIARALDAGINFFDTADGYGDGESETILGKALQSRREDVVIATKVGFPSGPGPNDRGLSRHHIHSAVDASLRRLGTDHIDLYQVHKRDRLTPLDVVGLLLGKPLHGWLARGLGGLIAAGGVFYLIA